LRHTTPEEISKLSQALSNQGGHNIAFLHVLPSDDSLPVTTEEVLPPIPKFHQKHIREAIATEPHPISLAKLNSYASKFIEIITYTPAVIKKVELATRYQRKSTRWFEEHYCRITSSNFGIFCKGSITTNKITELLYRGFKSTVCSSAIIWERTHEQSAFNQYMALLSNEYRLRESGIYISEHGFIAASPDGIVMKVIDSITEPQDCGVIEIKCPYTYRNLTVVKACNQKGFYCELINNEIHLKKPTNITIRYKDQWQLSELNGVTSLSGLPRI
jgi:hypothetical protein